MSWNNYLCFVLLLFMLRPALSSPFPETNNVAFHSQSQTGGIRHGSNVIRRVKRRNIRFSSSLGLPQTFCNMFGCDLVSTEKPSPRRSRSFKCRKGERYDRRYRKCRKLV
ncbi:unnamed protein product [Larinioides sclopetarius]|uniref:Uncharacterized protein n=1 Tax=Larinioides sclopetarius TaxID=280406 RepID=A0AAV2B773_9ARAC